MILDGLETLQEREGHNKGKIRDPAVVAMLNRLTEDKQNRCLCIITTREPLDAKAGFQKHVGKIDLEDEKALSDESACELLRLGGVDGADKHALVRLANACSKHPLALNLAAAYVRNREQRKSERQQLPLIKITKSKVNELPFVQAGKKKTPQEQAESILEDFYKQLKLQQRQVLLCLALFKRPADYAALSALRKANIESLTREIPDSLAEIQWRELIEELQQLRLLSVVSLTAGNDDTLDLRKTKLDMHPVVRDFFGKRLREDRKAWVAGHLTLRDHFIAKTSAAKKDVDKKQHKPSEKSAG